MTSEAEHYFQSALEWFKHQNGSKGIIDLYKAIELDPDNLIYRQERLEREFAADVDHIALEDANKIIELSTDSEVLARAYKRRMQWHETYGRDEDFIEDITWLIDNGHGNDFYLDWRGAVELKLGRLEGALQSFTQAHQLAPSWAHHLISRARVYYAMKKYPEALYDLKRSMSVHHKEEPASHFWLGKVYFKLGKHKLSLKYFNKVVCLYQMKHLDSPLEYMKLWAPDEIEDQDK